METQKAPRVCARKYAKTCEKNGLEFFRDGETTIVGVANGITHKFYSGRPYPGWNYVPENDYVKIVGYKVDDVWRFFKEHIAGVKA